MKNNEAGFALIGSLLIASVATVLVTVAQKVVPAKARAPQPTLTSILAEQKLEELRGLAWGFDETGVPVVVHQLLPSPDGALQQNTTGYVDYLDARGVVLGGGAAPPPGTAYVRRWSIEPLKTNPENAVVIKVFVTASHGRPKASQFPARLTAMKVRSRLSAQ